MSITVQDRFLRVRDCFGEGKASAILQDTLDLPGDFPDVGRVVGARAVARKVEAVVEDGRVVVKGSLEAHLLYAVVEEAREPRRAERDYEEAEGAAEDQEDDVPARPRLVAVRFPEVSPFEVMVDVPGATARMGARALVSVESVTANLVTRRRLGCDAALVVTVAVWDDQEVKAAVELAALPPSKVRTTRETVHVEHLVAEATSRQRLELSLALPPEELPVHEVLWVMPLVNHVTGRAGDGRAFLEGIMDIGVVYLTGDPDHPVNAFRWPDAHRLVTALELPAARTGMTVNAAVEVEDAAGDRESDRVVTIALDCRLRATARLPVEQPLVTDVASESGEQLDVGRKTILFPHPLAEVMREATAAGTLSLPPTRPPIDDVVWAGGVFVPDVSAVADDRVECEGDLSLQMLYQAATPDGALHMVEFPRALRLSQAIDLPGVRPGMVARCEVQVCAVDVRCLDQETVQVQVAVRIKCTCVRVVQCEVVVEAVVISPCPPGTTLRMVIVQPGDTMWKLARRYGVTLDALIKANPQIANPDLIYPGQRLRIPCSPVVLPAADRGAAPVAGGRG
ncbi:MAG: SafA/ExsA family spore coat assembly protein [Chitinophagales bacterium]